MTLHDVATRLAGRYVKTLPDHGVEVYDFDAETDATLFREIAVGRGLHPGGAFYIGSRTRVLVFPADTSIMLMSPPCTAHSVAHPVTKSHAVLMIEAHEANFRPA